MDLICHLMKNMIYLFAKIFPIHSDAEMQREKINCFMIKQAGAELGSSLVRFGYS